ncbi:MAG: hypothetical protein V7K27_01620 [Nostoc sp.]
MPDQTFQKLTQRRLKILELRSLTNIALQLMRQLDLMECVISF